MTVAPYVNTCPHEGQARWRDRGGVEWQARQRTAWNHGVFFRVQGRWVECGEHVGLWKVLLGNLEMVTRQAKHRWGRQLKRPRKG